MAIHLARELTDASLQTIGEAFGGRNHATVLHACKRVSERLKTINRLLTSSPTWPSSRSAQQADRNC